MKTSTRFAMSCGFVVLSEFDCVGGQVAAQGDVSVYRGLLFRSVDASPSGPSCDAQGATACTPGVWEGIQVFDVSDPSDFEVHRAFLDEENTELVTYDLDLVFPDADPPLGAHTFRGCHDISVFVELELAAAACFRDAQLWDISDPINPELIWTFRNDAIVPDKLDLWHSSAFGCDGTVVAFGDESGGGVFNRCTDPTDDQGRVWFLDIESGEVVRDDLLANYKIPRVHDEGRCTMHNFNFIPQSKGRMTLVSASYTAGTTVVDVKALINGATEEEAEIGSIKPDGADTWSSYWHNGFIYTNDVARGVDIILLSDKARAGAVKLGLNNPQTQESVIH